MFSKGNQQRLHFSLHPPFNHWVCPASRCFSSSDPGVPPKKRRDAPAKRLEDRWVLVVRTMHPQLAKDEGRFFGRAWTRKTCFEAWGEDRQKRLAGGGKRRRRGGGWRSLGEHDSDLRRKLFLGQAFPNRCFLRSTRPSVHSYPPPSCCHCLTGLAQINRVGGSL